MTTSPCTKVCVIDARAGQCTGCLRTLAEIAGWGSMNEDQRAAVMAELPARQQASMFFSEKKNQASAF